jgi:hypothetical protein
MKIEMQMLKRKYAIPGLDGTWNSEWLIRVRLSNVNKAANKE